MRVKAIHFVSIQTKTELELLILQFQKRQLILLMSFITKAYIEAPAPKQATKTVAQT